MQGRTFFCCHDGEKWAAFASAELDNPSAQSLLLILNDQLAEQGIFVRRFPPQSPASSDDAELRRIRRDCTFWLEIVSQFQAGIDLTVPVDYPERFQAWSIFDDALSYLQQLGLNSLGREAEPRKSKPNSKTETVTESRISPRRGVWSFNDAPEPNSKWRFGPITGPLYSIAKAIEIDWRTLKQWNGRSVWIQRHHSRSYSVYFDSKAYLNKAQSRLGDAAKQHETT